MMGFEKEVLFVKLQLQNKILTSTFEKCFYYYFFLNVPFSPQATAVQLTAPQMPCTPPHDMKALTMWSAEESSRGTTSY